MQIAQFNQDGLQFTDVPPCSAPVDGFVWVFVDREDIAAYLPALQNIALQVGGSALLDLHCQDLGSTVHPSHYDYTSVYDLVIFRRLSTASEAQSLTTSRISTLAVGFAQFDKLLISVHPRGCYTTKQFIERYSKNASTAGRINIRQPNSPADLMLRMINVMVDSYLDLRKELSSKLEHWKNELLNPRSHFTNWSALMAARNELHTLEDLCEEQHDAMQEWLDAMREQSAALIKLTSQAEHDGLVARARDVIEHIDRVVRHVQRLEQTAESAIQIHFGAQSNRTNDIMRTLTALTAIFLPLNLITGFFGMNFETFPWVHQPNALWWTIVFMVCIALTLGLIFWRKRYIARTSR